MTLVKDVMSTQLVVVSPELSLRDLIELLANAHLGGAPVLARGKVVGVVTLDDVASFQASLPPVPTDGAGQIGWDEEPLPGGTEGEEAVGAYFLDTWADAGADLVERAAAIGGPEWDLLGEHTVGEAMTRRVCSIRPDETLEEAARRMEESDIHRLLVVDGDGLVGIITTSDITRAVADGRVP